MSTCVAITIKGTICGKKCKEGDYCGYHMKRKVNVIKQSITLNFYNQNTFTTDTIMILKTKLEQNYNCELINLNLALPTFDNRRTECAIILIIKGFCKQPVYDELINLPWDKKINLRNKVVNRIGKYALQFDKEEQEPDYENGIYRTIKYSNVKETNQMKKDLMELLNTDQLKCQAHHYHNFENTNAFHTKLPLIANVHLGDPLVIQYKWFFSSKPISEEINVTLNNQDLYIMNEKASCVDSHLKKTPILKYRN